MSCVFVLRHSDSISLESWVLETGNWSSNSVHPNSFPLAHSYSQLNLYPLVLICILLGHFWFLLYTVCSIYMRRALLSSY